MKTVAQIAKQIGVSKQAIYQFMDSDFKQKFSTTDGSLKINLKGEKLKVTAPLKQHRINGLRKSCFSQPVN